MRSAARHNNLASHKSAFVIHRYSRIHYLTSPKNLISPSRKSKKNHRPFISGYMRNDPRSQVLIYRPDIFRRVRSPIFRPDPGLLFRPETGSARWVGPKISESTKKCVEWDLEKSEFEVSFGLASLGLRFIAFRSWSTGTFSSLFRFELPAKFGDDMPKLGAPEHM